ncbi:MAG: hypothetical protein A4E65_02822 [Syntrophorhabdus sp. PtaU1.Bin153]|nr:MAG: hypothetical protein A4E65_02822 [Syntrophorhabdus sp. PtaU1.Bin153]
MKNMGIIRVCSVVMTILVLSALMPGRSHSWNAATHAYIEERLCKAQGQLDDGVLNNRIYGANAVDIFNDNFTSPYVQFAAYLHDTATDNFMKAWDEAGTGAELAFAYGFVSHNNTWGMDSTAHVSGITYGRGEGYVIAKAQVLTAMLKPLLEEQLGPLPDDVVVDICHYLVEYGVDFLVRTIDPSVGNKLMTAAQFRSEEVPALLANAYTVDFSVIAGLSLDDTEALIETTEGTFRVWMMGYGWALTQPNALDLVAEGLAEVGAEYLGLPPGSGEALVPTVKQGILTAMALCAPDIDRELRASTGWVNGKLSSHGISW